LFYIIYFESTCHILVNQCLFRFALHFGSQTCVYNDHSWDPKIAAVVDRMWLFRLMTLCNKRSNWELTIVVVVDRWSLLEGGHYIRFNCSFIGFYKHRNQCKFFQNTTQYEYECINGMCKVQICSKLLDLDWNGMGHFLFLVMLLVLHGTNLFFHLEILLNYFTQIFNSYWNFFLIF